MPDLTVHVQLQNLPKEGLGFLNNKADGYFKIFKDDELLYTSPVIDNDSNPKFGKVEINIGLTKLLGDFVFKVYDKNAGNDTFIGQAEISVPFSGDKVLVKQDGSSCGAKIKFLK